MFIHQRGPMSKVSIENATLFYLVTSNNAAVHTGYSNRYLQGSHYSLFSPGMFQSQMHAEHILKALAILALISPMNQIKPHKHQNYVPWF